MKSKNLSRRGFLGLAAGMPLFGAVAQKQRLKIRDVQAMVLKGPRTYTLVKVVADDGLYGIAEAYGSPAIGVKDQVLGMKPLLVGKDPLDRHHLHVYGIARG
jgi:L-alanine-DL-glutamate epimerase-like enolase superfamily enzyme